MLRLRAVFEKKDRAKYISHLDLNRCMLRTFRRSGIPIWFTEGFNPHPYFSFALALSLGYESSCEILDFNITDDNMSLDEVKERLNAVMPSGMRIVSVAEQVLKITAITSAEYSFSLVSENLQELYSAVEKLMAQESILIEKKTKKGIKTVDIKPDMNVISFVFGEKSVDMVMRLPAGTQTNYNPSLFIEALKNSTELAFDAEKITRTGIFCENGEKIS